MEGYLQIKVKNLSEPKFKSKLNTFSSRWSRKFVRLNPEFLNFYKSKEESDHHNHDFCLTSKELFKASIESKKGAIAIYNTVKNERFLLKGLTEDETQSWLKAILEARKKSITIPTEPRIKLNRQNSLSMSNLATETEKICSQEIACSLPTYSYNRSYETLLSRKRNRSGRSNSIESFNSSVNSEKSIQFMKNPNIPLKAGQEKLYHSSNHSLNKAQNFNTKNKVLTK